MVRFLHPFKIPMALLIFFRLLLGRERNIKDCRVDISGRISPLRLLLAKRTAVILQEKRLKNKLPLNMSLRRSTNFSLTNLEKSREDSWHCRELTLKCNILSLAQFVSEGGMVLFSLLCADVDVPRWRASQYLEESYLSAHCHAM